MKNAGLLPILIVLSLLGVTACGSEGAFSPNGGTPGSPNDGETCDVNTDCVDGVCNGSLCQAMTAPEDENDYEVDPENGEYGGTHFFVDVDACPNGNCQADSATVNDLYISEVMGSPDTKQMFDTLSDAPQCEFVEIVNRESKMLDLSDISLIFGNKSILLEGHISAHGVHIVSACDLPGLPKSVSYQVSLSAKGAITNGTEYEFALSDGRESTVAIRRMGNSNSKGISQTRKNEGDYSTEFVFHNSVNPNLKNSPGFCTNGGDYAYGCEDTCTDGFLNGSESDTDCGGSCAPCVNYNKCRTNSDCQTGLCVTGICTDQSPGTGPNCPGGYITDNECDTTVSVCIPGTISGLCRKVPEDVTVSEYLPVMGSQRCTPAQLHPREDTLRVHIIDVGQGDAIWIQTPTGQNILIDSGDAGLYGKTAGGPIVNDYMAFHGFPDGSELDAMILTHPDSDHYGGFTRILAQHPTRNYIDPGMEGTTLYQRWVKKVSGTNAKMYRPAGDFWSAGQSMPKDIFGNKVEAIYVYSDANAKDPNTGSIIFRLSFGERSFLFTGDATKAAETKAIADGKRYLSSNFLKVCHHGSDTSSSTAFLDAVLVKHDPFDRAAFISSGRKTFSGTTIPRPEIIQRLREYIPLENLFSTAAGDDNKEEEDAIRDDNVLIVIQEDGDYYACYSGTN